MQILDKDIRVNFTSIENQALRNGLDVVTRLASNISGDADTTSDIGVNAVSARDAINYLLNQGGSDNSLEVMSPYEGLIVTQEQMATLEEAKKILQGLISPASDDPGQDWWYLGLDLELPVDIGTENNPLIVTYEPDSLRIYKNRLAATGTLPYRLDFTFTGTDSTLYKVKQVINYTESTNSQTNITTGTWVVSGNPTYQKYENGTWSTISTPASTIWPVSTGGQPASITDAPTQYIAVLNKGGFNPNGAYNWISERSNITDAARELYDLYINVLNNYTVSDIEQFPTYDLGTWTWIDMPFKNIPIVFNNNSHIFTYYFVRDDQTNTGTLTDVNGLTSISLPKEEIDSVELPYHVSLGEGTVLNNDQVTYRIGTEKPQILSNLTINEANANSIITLESIAYVSVALDASANESVTGKLIYEHSGTGTRLELDFDNAMESSIERVVPIEATEYKLVNYQNIYPSITDINFIKRKVSLFDEDYEFDNSEYGITCEIRNGILSVKGTATNAYTKYIPIKEDAESLVFATGTQKIYFNSTANSGSGRMAIRVMEDQVSSQTQSNLDAVTWGQIVQFTSNEIYNSTSLEENVAENHNQYRYIRIFVAQGQTVDRNTELYYYVYNETTSPIQTLDRITALSQEITVYKIVTTEAATLRLQLADNLLSGSYLIGSTEYWITPSLIERYVDITGQIMKVNGVTINSENITVTHGPGFKLLIGNVEQESITLGSQPIVAIIDKDDSANFS